MTHVANLKPTSTILGPNRLLNLTVASSGEAMSVPVLGTILGLCLTYILPRADGLTPKDCHWFDIHPQLYRSPGKANGSDCDSTSDISSTAIGMARLNYPRAGGLEVKLYHSEFGLIGLYLKHRYFAHPQCHYCMKDFEALEPIYEWRTTDGEIIYLHEGCLLDESEDSKCHFMTLDYVRAMQMKTNSDDLLNTLLSVEDDLTRDYVHDWREDDDIMDDVAVRNSESPNRPFKIHKSQ